MSASSSARARASTWLNRSARARTKGPTQVFTPAASVRVALETTISSTGVFASTLAPHRLGSFCVATIHHPAAFPVV